MKGEQDDDGDRLREIHDELQDQQDKSPSSWLPLESNPQMFTTFSRRIGLSTEWSFIDVFSFDNDTLLSIPRPVAAVILLFPCTDSLYAARAVQKKNLLQAHASGNLSPAAKSALHIEQVASFGNACGSIAAIHALSNADLSLLAGPLAQFKESTSHLFTARERGNVLVASDIHGLSDESATDNVAQTECPENGDTYLGHHYCCFVGIGGHIVELDGTKVVPVDHGRIPNDSDLLKETARVVREVFMSVEPDRIDFSLMALARTG